MLVPVTGLLILTTVLFLRTVVPQYIGSVFAVFSSYRQYGCACSGVAGRQRTQDFYLD